MIRVAFFSICCFAFVAHAASLQDPNFTTAYYTTFYPGGGSVLNSVNNSGVGVGEFLASTGRQNPPHAVVYDYPQYLFSRGFQELYAVPFSNGTTLTGINDKNTYIGYGALPGLSGVSGFVGSYDPSAYPFGGAVAPFNFPGATATYALGLNNQGTIVGGYISSTDGLEHGFIYRPDGSFQTLDDPAYRNTALIGINNLGQIVGSGASDPSGSARTGFLYSGNSFVDFNYGVPTGINDRGEIAMDTLNYGGGVLYPDGTFTSVLASIQFQSDPFAVQGIAAINNQGTLVFNSGYAFIATPVASPVPEPSSLALLTAGALSIVGICVQRRRRGDSFGTGEKP